MKIAIHQEPLGLINGFKFEIFLDEKLTYIAEAKIGVGIFVRDLEGQEIFRLMTQFSWFKPKVLIRFADNSTAQYSTITVWKKHYKLQYIDDTYDIYGHSRRRASIYKNNVQIGWYQKEAIAVMSGDRYNAVCNNDADFRIIIALMLIRDITKPSRKKSAINIDGGSFGPFTKKFNDEWKPGN